MIKKLFKLFLCSILIFTLAFPVNAKESSENDKITQVNTVLLKGGVPDDLVKCLSTKTKLEMYEKMKKYDVAISNVEEKIINFTSPQSNDKTSPFSTIPESKLSIQTFYVNYILGTKITTVEVCWYSKWLTTPVIQLRDAFIMNWDSSLLALDGFYGLAGTNVDNSYVDLETITRPSEASQGGFGFNFKTSDNHLNGRPTLEVVAHFVPCDPLYITSSKRSNINCGYAHKIIAVAPEIGFDQTGGNLSFSGGTAFDTATAIINYYSERNLVNEIS